MRTTIGAVCTVVFLFAAPRAHAQSACFSVAGEAAPRPQQLVGLDAVVRVDGDCRYALDSDGPWVAAGALAGRDTDFAEIFAVLARERPHTEGDARVVFARRPGAPRGAAPETLMLRYCAHYLLEEQLGFRAVPASDGASFRIERAAAAECDAAHLEVRAIPGANGEAFSSITSEHTLEPARPSLVLPEGDWSLYAARPGGAVGLRIGVFSAHRAVTPLQHRLRTATADTPPLLVAVWQPSAPGMLLHPSLRAQAEPMVWPELRTAADAGLLWLVRRVRGETRVIAPLALEAEPAAVRLPDAVVRDGMVARYGDAGATMTPAPTDWRAILSGLDVCLTADYRAPRIAAAGDLLPEGSTCATLGRLATLAQAEAGVPASGGRVCLERGMQVMSSDRATHVEATGEPQCFALPEASDTTPTVQRFLAVGDRLRVEGQGLCVAVDGQVVEPSAEGAIVAPRAGLLEVRQGAGAECSSQQGLARLRLPVIDPEREWHPVGLYTGADPASMRCDQDDETAGTCPWRAVPHDEDTTFAYVRSRYELEWRLSASPAVGAAVNADPTQPVQLTEAIPTLGGVRGAFQGARPPAIVAVNARGESCPTETYRELRERPPLDPDARLPDTSLHVFLAAVEGDDAPVHCLARAKLRVRPSRAIYSTGFADVVGLEFGLLGDTRAVFFLNEPLAMGVSLSIVHFRVSFWHVVALEVGGGLVIAGAFPTTMTTGMMSVDVPAQLSRLGAALMATLEFGIPEILPRLLSFGAMVHGAAETHSVENPVASLFIGLNLSSLVDLAGGR